ncbi:hypothetical protein [Tenacibaculum maritimum]|uniref:hypothetical protein n=1 Tax=Tenacibaculum maritimum TaxID=107401 RepID=UPI0012E59CE9|nr:hypothetical protein [Tenacibaculum maritimum]CAA0188819.1 probable lipoprotein precursor. Putative metallo-peptidase [Tenacibaculum maritimum]
MKKFNLLLALAIAAQVFTSCENNEVLNEEIIANSKSTKSLNLTESEQKIYTTMSSLLKEGKGFNFPLEKNQVNFIKSEEDHFLQFEGAAKKSYLLESADHNTSSTVILDEDNEDIDMLIKTTEKGMEKLYTFHLRLSSNSQAIKQLKAVKEEKHTSNQVCQMAPLTTNPSRELNFFIEGDGRPRRGSHGRYIGAPEKKTSWRIIIHKSGEADLDIDRQVMFMDKALRELDAFNSFLVSYLDASAFHEKTKNNYDSKSVLEQFNKELKSTLPERLGKSGPLPSHAPLHYNTLPGWVHIFARKETFGKTLGEASGIGTKWNRVAIISASGPSSDDVTLAHEIGHLFGAHHIDGTIRDGFGTYSSIMLSGQDSFSAAQLFPTLSRFDDDKNRYTMIQQIQGESFGDPILE